MVHGTYLSFLSTFLPRTADESIYLDLHGEA